MAQRKKRTPLIFIPIRTKIISEEDDLTEVLLRALRKAGVKLRNGDVVVVASKVVSTTLGYRRRIKDSAISKEARSLARKTGLPEGFVQMVIDECGGRYYGHVKGAILTLTEHGLYANAGLDRSNSGSPKDHAVLLPKNCEDIAISLRNTLKRKTGKKIGVIICDSHTQPMRLGTIGMALATAGVKPTTDERGKKDIFGYSMKITRRAIADCVCSASQILMGETDEQTPFVICRNSGLEPSDKRLSRTMKIAAKKCLYFGPLYPYMTKIMKTS
ncbi:MAG: coenzyme F420-0:L-glutamate ligase [Aigarchaeota archaeon]|nr:coenzyme F420-0:L-glutamate ligase [Aigarchaeota archaeon]